MQREYQLLYLILIYYSMHYSTMLNSILLFERGRYRLLALGETYVGKYKIGLMIFYKTSLYLFDGDCGWLHDCQKTKKLLN